MTKSRIGLISLTAIAVASCAAPTQTTRLDGAGAIAPPYDVLIDDGTIYDGSGGAPYVGDVAMSGDRIVCVGRCGDRAVRTIDARGLAVAPGFINMLSWANETLIADGRGQSDIRQGVTLEVMGEGVSMGPWNEAMKRNE